jgi:hypothetical protein
MAQRNFVAWRYTDDNGVEYVRRADAALVAQQGDNAPLGAVGGSSAAGLSPYEEMPANLKPRYAICKEAGVAFRANVVIYDPAAMAALTTGTTTFVVRDGGGTNHTVVVLAKHQEQPRGAIGA